MKNKTYLTLAMVVGGIIVAGSVFATRLEISNLSTQTPELKATVQAQTQVNPTFLDEVKADGWSDSENQDIKAKIASQIEQDPQITSASVSKSDVSMDYKTPGKLFGFIDITMNTHISSDIEGHVKVQFPWYKFLVTSDYDHAAEAINGVFQTNQTNYAFMQAKGSTSAQLQIFTTISDAMRSIPKAVITK